MDLAQAHEAIDSMLEGNAFGAAGARVVIEDFLKGEEASFIVMVDGQHILPMASSQDHKRLLDHDMGPNTGGMGAYSPAPIVTPQIHEQVMREIIRPTVDGMAADGIPFTGFLYAGLMIDRDSEGNSVVKTLEFNCRMGDPETQPIMSRLTSSFVDLIEAAIDGRLDTVEAQWDNRVALGVVCAAKGYPESQKKAPRSPCFLPMATAFMFPCRHEKARWIDRCFRRPRPLRRWVGTDRQGSRSRGL